MKKNVYEKLLKGRNYNQDRKREKLATRRNWTFKGFDNLLNSVFHNRWNQKNIMKEKISYILSHFFPLSVMRVESVVKRFIYMSTLDVCTFFLDCCHASEKQSKQPSPYFCDGVKWEEKRNDITTCPHVSL